MKKTAILLIVLLLTFSARAGTIRYVDLLDQMTDMVRLATLPQPGETCQQFSSYDRRSVAPDKPNWGANGDSARHIA